MLVVDGATPNKSSENIELPPFEEVGMVNALSIDGDLVGTLLRGSADVDDDVFDSTRFGVMLSGSEEAPPPPPNKSPATSSTFDYKGNPEVETAMSL